MYASENENVTFQAHQISGASRAVRIWSVSSLLFVGIICLGLMAVTFLKVNVVDDLRLYENTLRSEVGLLDQLRSQKQSLEQSCGDLTKRTRKIHRCTDPECNSPYIFLKEVANLTPPGIELQSLVCAMKALQITGQAQSMRQLTKFMHALGKSSLFAEPKLVDVHNEKDDSSTKVLFELRLLKGNQ